jgi:hypothetical protein
MNNFLEHCCRLDTNKRFFFSCSDFFHLFFDNQKKTKKSLQQMSDWFGWVGWLTCNISQTQKQLEEEIKEETRKKDLEENKKKLSPPLHATPKSTPVTMAVPKPVPQKIPFIATIIGIVPSIKNTDNATKKYKELLVNGPNAEDKAGVLFICRYVDHEKMFNIFVQDTASLSKIEDAFVVLNRIPVRRSIYTVSLIYSFFNYCQRKREVHSDGEIRSDRNWYEPPADISELRFKTMIQTICSAVNDHPSFVGEIWPQEVQYDELTKPKRAISFDNPDDETKKK